jgi:hypothetical protein
MSPAGSDSAISRQQLEDAAAALSQATELLRQSIQSDSDDVIEAAYAVFRVARAKLGGALADYREQCVKASP